MGKRKRRKKQHGRNKGKRRVSKSKRLGAKKIVLARDGYRCRICGKEGTSKNPLTVHHIVYKRDGGRATPENLITYCQKCHRRFHKIHG